MPSVEITVLFIVGIFVLSFIRIATLPSVDVVIMSTIGVAFTFFRAMGALYDLVTAIRLSSLSLNRK